MAIKLYKKLLMDEKNNQMSIYDLSIGSKDKSQLKLKIAEALVFLDDTFSRIKRLFDGITKLLKGNADLTKIVWPNETVFNQVTKAYNNFVRWYNDMTAEAFTVMHGGLETYAYVFYAEGKNL